MALGVTLAPFAALEKPDLCPRPGASFGKDALSYTRACVRQGRFSQRKQPGSENITVWKYSDFAGFFGRVRSERSSKKSTKITFSTVAKN
jgi:hypothetical protein